MSISCPAIYAFGTANIKEKMEEIEKIGYTKEEVIKITKSIPKIYALKIEGMKRKFMFLQSLNYTKEEVIKMTTILPALYEISSENAKEKIVFYESIGLRNMIIRDTRQLLQGIDLTYARYQLLKQKGIIIDMTNYRLLFLTQDKFEKRYGATKKELLELYPYSKEENKVKQK